MAGRTRTLLVLVGTFMAGLLASRLLEAAAPVRHGLLVTGSGAGCSMAIAEEQFVLGRITRTTEGSMGIPCGQTQEVAPGVFATCYCPGP